MNIKKIIVLAAWVLSAWISVGGAQAQTTYDFTFTYVVSSTNGWTGEDPSTQILLNGIVTGNGINLSNPIFTTLSGPGLGNASYAVTAQSTATPWITLASTTPFPYLDVNYYQILPLTSSFTFTANGINYTSNYVAGNEILSGGGLIYDPSTKNVDHVLWRGNVTSPLGGAAPEMNASFIPQVGLLLGCIFFLMGRKKKVLEKMLAA